MSCPHGNHPDGCEFCEELNVLHREIGELQRRAEGAEASATAWNEAATLMKQRATTAEAALEKARENEGAFTEKLTHMADEWEGRFDNGFDSDCVDELRAAIDAARGEGK